MIKYIFTFSGRLNRKPYWIGTLLALLVIFLPIGFAVYLVESEFPEGVMIAFAAAAAVPFVLGFAATFSFAMRRLHDRNKGWGWFIFLMILPTISSILVAASVLEEYGPIDIVSTIISTYAFIELGFFRGTNGGNQYGPDPLSGDIVDNRTFD